MRRAFVIFVTLPLTFALLPLAAVLMTPGAPARDTTLVLEQEPASPGAGLPTPAGVAAWDAAEFGGRDGALTFRGAEPNGGPAGGCEEVPQG